VSGHREKVIGGKEEEVGGGQEEESIDRGVCEVAFEG
jgi:hypothetical protein